MKPPRWLTSDVWAVVSDGLAAAKHDILLVSPYIGDATVRALLEKTDPAVGITMVTTLAPMSFASGASDIDALIAVTERPSGTVRSLADLHAKAYLRDWTKCWVGSANFTRSGLSMGISGNVEVVAEIEGLPSDLSEILRAILHRSRTVDRELLEWIRDQVPVWRSASVPELVDLRLPAELVTPSEIDVHRPSNFLFQEMPFLGQPSDLCHDGSDPVSLAHDRFLFGVNPGDSEDECLLKCRAHFLHIPVISDLSEFLAKPRWFGELSGWFHDRCEDRPLPYRSEIKMLVSRILTWLLKLYPDQFASARPGHSTCYGRVDADWTSVDQRP